MSLILDALNRSRQDEDELPGLATQHYLENDGGQDRNWRNYLPWLALLAALLVIGWLVFDGDSRTPAPIADSRLSEPAASPPGQVAGITTPAAQPAPEVAEPVIAAGVQPPVSAASDPAMQEQTAAVAQPETGSAVADLYQRQAPASVEAPPARESAAPEDLESATQPATQPVAGDLAAQAQEDTEPEQPIDIEKVILQAREDLGNARLQEHPAPFIADLSQQTKDSIPTIFYERHDYSGERGRSVVVLNGKTLGVGGSAASGVKVDEILSDSVVLNYRGTQFRLKALNSWINL